jgi:hypothetical protein
MEPVDPTRVNYMRAIVNSLGAPLAVSRRCQTSRQSVHNWCARGVVYHSKPAVLLYRACQADGLDVTLDAIVGLAPAPKRLRRKRPAKATVAA